MGNIASIAKLFVGRFDFNIGHISFSLPYIQAALIVFLIFLLIVSLAQLRRHFVNWSAK